MIQIQKSINICEITFCTKIQIYSKHRADTYMVTLIHYI